MDGWMDEWIIDMMCVDLIYKCDICILNVIDDVKFIYYVDDIYDYDDI